MECDLKDFYRDGKEAIPPDTREPCQMEVTVGMFVDSSHADDNKTRRSRTGYLIYLNMTPVAWIPKK